MSLPEIAEEAPALNEQKRATLALKLIDTLSTNALEVPDEEAMRRDEELENGAVSPVMHEDFVRYVQDARCIF